MSLALALNNALSGLNASQQSLAVISQNIANANNENYSRQRSNQSAIALGGDVGAGVEIESVTRIVDERIAKSVVTKGSDAGRSGTISDYYNQAQIYFGQPGSNNSLDTYVTAFFNSAANLSSTVAPDRASYRQDVISKAASLTDSISSLAGNIENLRFQADQEIGSSIDDINLQLQNIQRLNLSITSAQGLGNSITTYQDQINQALKKISGHIDIQYRVNSNNTVTINTGTGAPLIEDGIRYQLTYTPSHSVQDLINNVSFGAISVYRTNTDGTLSNESSGNLASPGTSDDVTTVISSGSIKGLLEVRDQLFPNILDQLNNMAANLRDAVNAVHNDGVGFPPPAELTGTTLISPTTTDRWFGKAMIAILGDDGRPISSPYASGYGIGFEPLTLDLGALDDGSGVGRPSYQSIIDAINQHFGAPQNRSIIVDTSNNTLLNDISLTAQSDSLAAGTGTFNFTVNLSNLTAEDSEIRITGASVTPAAGAVTVTTPAAFPTAYVTATAGQTTTPTALNFALDMTGATSGPYTVSVDVEVKDHNGGTVTGTLTYTIADGTAALLNDQYHVASASGNASVENPSTLLPFMTASLVDANGNAVAKDPITGDYTAAGYVHLETSDSSYRIAISELDSQQSVSGRGFSHFLGLNNFFVDDGGGTDNAAINMSVRTDILSDPSLLSTGTLVKSANDGDITKYTYETANASAAAIKNLSSLGFQTASFDAAGGLAEVSLTFADYMAEIIGYSASRTSDASQDSYQKTQLLQGFVDKDQAIRGVNLDEELANTIIFQNAYSANARIISVTKDLFDALLNTF